MPSFVQLLGILAGLSVALQHIEPTNQAAYIFHTKMELQVVKDFGQEAAS